MAGPTDIAHCPITDCGQGGGRFTRIRQKPESRKASTLRCFTLWLRWRFLTELLITITQAIVVAKSTIPTTSGSDGRLRYGCTLPQHHPHRRQEHLLYGMPANLILNGERLPIGTSDLNGDISEEEEFGPPQAPQWSDADWDAYQTRPACRTTTRTRTDPGTTNIVTLAALVLDANFRCPLPHRPTATPMPSL